MFSLEGKTKQKERQHWVQELKRMSLAMLKHLSTLSEETAHPTVQCANLRGNVWVNQRGAPTCRHNLCSYSGYQKYSRMQGPWAIWFKPCIHEYFWWPEYEYRLDRQTGAPLWFTQTFPLKMFASGNLFFVSTVEKFQILECRKTLLMFLPNAFMFFPNRFLRPGLARRGSDEYMED